MSDDGLALAVNRVNQGIIVMEDVDALFNQHRERLDACNTVTFSGLLNAIDGVGSPKGTLFIYTTNHPDRLDPALVRRGRVDREFNLAHCTEAMARAMFLRFYPGCERDAAVRAQRAEPRRRRVHRPAPGALHRDEGEESESGRVRAAAQCAGLDDDVGVTRSPFRPHL